MIEKNGKIKTNEILQFVSTMGEIMNDKVSKKEPSAKEIKKRIERAIQLEIKGEKIK